MADLDASLMNIVQQETLNWIFVGGKGGEPSTSVKLSLHTFMLVTRYTCSLSLLYVFFVVCDERV